MARTYTYNVVLESNNIFQKYELLTDLELEKAKLAARHSRDFPKTRRARVFADTCYFSFGARFGAIKCFLD